MMEYSQRYQLLSDFLVRQGFRVIVFDLPGHGPMASPLGHVPAYSGWSEWLAPYQEAICTYHRAYPDLPLFLLGHSMGSYLAQYLATEYGTMLSGLILSGTSYVPPLLAQLGRRLTACLYPKETSTATWIHRMTFLGFQRRIASTQTPYDWLSTDASAVTAYCQDPLCGNVCSSGFFQALFHGLSITYTTPSLSKIPLSLPILFLTGQQDPLSRYGKTVQQLISLYRRLGHTQLTAHFYEAHRHEVLQGHHVHDVYQDLSQWLSRHLPHHL
jgi:Lysophospholipase